MLYLAQIHKKLASDPIELQLLVQQQEGDLWLKCNQKLTIEPQEFLTNGLLVLVDINEKQEILEIKNAKDWVLKLVQTYVSDTAINPKFLEQEKSILEHWRQELTSQSQDLTRIRLELETRREQLQELEATLNSECDSGKQD